MSVSVFTLLAIAYAVAGAAVLLASGWTDRRLRSPRRLRVTALLAVAVLLPANVAVAACDAAGLTLAGPVAAGLLTAGVMVGCGLVALALMHGIRRAPAAAPRRVLAIGAHPDDIEIACGGTLAKFADAGHEVHALVLTRGECGGRADERPAEALRGGRFLGVARTEVCDFADTRLAEQEVELTLAIEAAIARLNPDIVLTHSANDMHQDHVAVHRATLRAGRRHPSILCYESPSATPAFSPRVFVDIEDYLDVKVAAVALHADQRGKPYVGAEQVRGLAVFRGSQARARHAEGYEPMRLSGVGLGGS